MCEKNHVDSSLVLSLMNNAVVVTDLITSQKAHLVIPYHPCYSCIANCHAFMMNDRWYGLSKDEFQGYQEQIQGCSEALFIPG